jgi:hypothetical protein
MTSAFSLADLRSQSASVIVGFILLAAGLAAMALFVVRRISRERTLIYFSLFTVLYALRLLFHASVIRSISGLPPRLFLHFDLWTTSTLLIPFLLYLRQVFGPPARTLMNVLLIAPVTFAVVAITADAFGVGEALAYSINNYVVVAIVAVLLINHLVMRSRGSAPPWTRESFALTLGLVVFGLFVLRGNLVSLRVMSGRDWEPFGFLFFVACLGYVAVHRAFANEHRLLAIDGEMAIARQIQSSILPRTVPSVPGLEIAARYSPMSAVAGDFYDFFVLENSCVGILVADVTGHGVPAAIIASMLKIAFAAQKVHAEHPEKVLAGLNETLCGKFDEHFVTAAYLYVDLGGKLVRYAGAGHPPLLRCTRADGVHAVEHNGFFLYTDGLPESASAKFEEFGLERCKEFLASHAQLSAATLADELLGEIARWSSRTAGRPQEDDMTLVVVDWRG